MKYKFVIFSLDVVSLFIKIILLCLDISVLTIVQLKKKHSCSEIDMRDIFFNI